MKIYNKIKKGILRLLYQYIKKDPNVLCFFIHGSFVTGHISKYAYRDERYFLDEKYRFSLIKQVKAFCDVDCFVISKDGKGTKKMLEGLKVNSPGVYITFNIIDKDTFFSEIFQDGTRALKRILLFKPLIILKGQKLIDEAKEKLSKIPRFDFDSNKKYQQEFDTRKKFFGFLGENGVTKIKINRDFFDSLCPAYTKFVAGEIDTGFPSKRFKVVLPRSMRLKAHIDLETLSVKELE